jgi:hypothetical protein
MIQLHCNANELNIGNGNLSRREHPSISVSWTVYTENPAKNKAGRQRAWQHVSSLSRSLSANNACSLLSRRSQASSVIYRNMDTSCAPHVAALCRTRRSLTTPVTTIRFACRPPKPLSLNMKLLPGRKPTQMSYLFQVDPLR